MKKFKLDIKASQKICALTLAGVLLITGLTGCASKDVYIRSSSTITTTLDYVSDYTNLDEILADAYYESDGEKISWEDLLTEYEIARGNEDAPKCNSSLYKIGRVLLKASIAEHLGIGFEQIRSFTLTSSKDDSENILTQHIDVSYITSNGGYKETRIRCVDEPSDLRYNVVKASVGAWQLESSSSTTPTIDDVYRSYVEYLLTSGTLKKSSGGVMEFSTKLDEEKVEAYNSYGGYSKKLSINK